MQEKSSVQDELLAGMLIASGALSRRALQEALEERSDTPLSTLLVERGLLSEDEVRRAQAQALGVPFVTLESIDPEALSLVPEPLCRSLNCLAYAAGDVVEVAVLSLGVLPELEPLRGQASFGGRRIAARLTTKEALRRGLLQYQRQLRERFGAAMGSGDGEVLLRNLVEHARLSAASAIELTLGARAQVRYRTHGSLHDALELSERAGRALGAVLRVGTVTVELGHGESATLRCVRAPGANRWTLTILPRGRGYALEDIGFHGTSLERVHAILAARTGLVLIAGEEGGGRSTLLYTLLHALNAQGASIITVESPVGSPLQFATQIAAGEGNPLSVAAAVRAAARMESDVLAVDAIEDRDTLAVALGAAARGTFVLATVAARGSANAIDLVRRLGASDKELAALVKGVIATAVLPKLCTKKFMDMRRGARGELNVFEAAGANFGRVLSALKEEEVAAQQLQWKDVTFGTPAGCSECSHGYKGTLGVHEVLAPSLIGADLLRRGAGGAEVVEQSRTEGMLTLVEDGLFKAAAGQTSLEALKFVRNDISDASLTQ
ncbi:MAG: Flp pilus assembly complex ATPase component TadA [Patescibacteria group bacterium]|nr:Flp pilus assembly complex ATPase component TadA [Patescibacteria group bacterium]